MKRVKITLPEGGRRIVDGNVGSLIHLRKGLTYEIEAEEIIIEGDVKLSGKVNSSQPEALPFDLEAAKAGAPLVTRSGRKVNFVAHDQGANEGFRLLVRIEGDGCAFGMPEKGRWDGIESLHDLFMAPKPKRTVWVNIYPSASQYDTEADAISMGDYRRIATVPVEIDA